MINDKDIKHLQRCIELAEVALEQGDEPFGSVLVAADGKVLAEDRNRVGSGDPTLHPEFTLVQWAVAHMGPEERAKATVYTSGEHCPMCSAAHGLAGLGKIVYASSSKQMAQWMKEMGVDPIGIQTLPIEEIIRDAEVQGPVPELDEQVRQLHIKSQAKKS